MSQIYGFELQFNPPPKKNWGFELQPLQNCYLYFRSQFGDVLQDVDSVTVVREVNGAITQEVYTNVNNLLALSVEVQTNFTVFATDQDIQGSLSFTHNGAAVYFFGTVILTLPVCTARPLINRSNYWGWRRLKNTQIDNLTLDTFTFCEGQNDTLPAINWARRCDQPMIFSPGDTLNIMINFNKGYTGPETLQIDLVSGTQRVVINAATLNFAPHPSGTGSVIYFTYIVPPASLLEISTYHFIIYNINNLEALFITKPIQLIENPENHAGILEARNTYNRDGYNFEDLPEFKLRYRIPFNQNGQAILEQESRTSNEATTGKRQNVWSIKRIKYPMVFFNADQPTTEFIQSLAAFDEVAYNGKGYTLEVELEIEEREFQNQSNCLFGMYEDDYQEINR